jgi:hypothetical protein
MRVNEEYKQVIIRLIEATEEGKINWKRQNPATIFYEKITRNGEKAIMSIQNVGPRERGQLVFNVQNATKNEIVISIDSMANSEFREMLFDLFDRAMYSIEKRSLDFLRDIISEID